MSNINISHNDLHNHKRHKYMYLNILRLQCHIIQNDFNRILRKVVYLSDSNKTEKAQDDLWISKALAAPRANRPPPTRLLDILDALFRIWDGLRDCRELTPRHTHGSDADAFDISWRRRRQELRAVCRAPEHGMTDARVTLAGLEHFLLLRDVGHRDSRENLQRSTGIPSYIERKEELTTGSLFPTSLIIWRRNGKFPRGAIQRPHDGPLQSNWHCPRLTVRGSIKDDRRLNGTAPLRQFKSQVRPTWNESHGHHHKE